ncbi:MAG: hypothetical protein OXM55_03085 [Bdellovibrionales bacterium]|nr:hypothetical protein [Bdellovibrionales bacterium]
MMISQTRLDRTSIENLSFISSLFPWEEASLGRKKETTGKRTPDGYKGLTVIIHYK